MWLEQLQLYTKLYHSALLLEMIESSNCLISLPAPGIVSFNFLFHFIIDI